MKFDFIIGNPPYQEESNGEKRNYAPPIYHLFIKSAYDIGNSVELIHPARFLFNAGSTPKQWNESMLNDEHLSILSYEPDSSIIFPGTDIKGGIVITYHDNKKNFGAISVFSPFPEMNTILQKVKHYPNFISLSSIVYSRTSYRLTKELHIDNPWASSRLSNGHDFDMSSNIFELLPEVFFDSPNNEGDFARIIGRKDGKRVSRYIKRCYINDVENFASYKVFVAQANGSGLFGETMSLPIVEGRNVGATETFLSIGNFENEDEARSLSKYIQTRFARALLGVLKVTQNGNKPVWRMIPLQDFSPTSDIDWDKSIAEIDRQLYAKYGLDDKEIEFIETHVKEMA